MRARALMLVLLVGLLAGCDRFVVSPGPPSIEQMIHQVFDPYGEGDKAVRVARCESGLEPNAVGGGGTYKGLFQLGPHIVAIHAYGGNRHDPWANINAARDLYVQRGNWSAWPHCGRL